MKKIDSGALGLLNRVLGLAGAGGAQHTTLDDGVVNQVLDVGPIVSRSRAFGREGGWYIMALQCAHAAADSQVAIISPYAAGAAFVANGFPADVDAGWDIWILGAGLQLIAGTAGNFTNGQVFLGGDEDLLGLGIDESGAAIGAGARRIPLAVWDSVTSIGNLAIGLQEDGKPWAPIRIRLPRKDCTVAFRSTSSGAVTVSAEILIAIVPAALGQDVYV